MEINDRIKAILRVQLELNFLKLCADHKKPEGKGVPVDIVAMPDFVADMDGYAVEQLNQGKLTQRLSSAEVGSRAGRILSILAHLRDLDDEGFNLHYIAKTGDVGRAVLKKRLDTDLRERHLQPLHFPFLLNSKETRYAILGRSEFKKGRRQLITNKDILTCDDLVYHFYNPLDVLSKAAAVYFGTDSTNQFLELIEPVFLGKESGQTNSQTTEQQSKGGDRYVFIDLSALGEDEDKEACNKKLKDLIKKRNNKAKKRNDIASCTHLAVMVDGSQSSDLSQLWSEFSLCKGDALLLYDNKEMCIIDANSQNNPHKVELPYRQRPGSRDAFVAGFLLHRAVAWSRIPPLENLRHLYSEGKDNPASKEEVNAWKENWPQGLFPNRYKIANTDGWPLSEAVCFGQALAALWREESDILPDRWNLLYKNVETPEQEEWIKDSDDLKSRTERVLDFVRNLQSKSEPRLFFLGITLLVKLWFEETISDNLANEVKEFLLSLLNEDLSIQPTLWKEKGNKRSHALLLPSQETIRTQFVLDALRRMSMVEKQWKTDPPKRACLFDLDGTLIQSSGLRRMCLRRAFLAMLDEDPVCDKVTRTFPAIGDDLRLREQVEWPVPDVPTLLDRCERLYHYAIYSRWEDWKDILMSYPYYAFGDLSKDFRQVWNHPLSYAVLVHFIGLCLEEKEWFYSPLGNTPGAVMIRACSDDCYPEVERILSKEIEFTPTKKLLGPYDDTLQQDVAIWDQTHRKIFQAAVNMYWNVEYQTLPYMKQFLRTLRDVLSVKLYVATEGHHDTQLAKLKVVSLDQFFSDLCIMSTGAAATPAEHLQRIDNSITQCNSDIKLFDREFDWIDEEIERRFRELQRAGQSIDKDSEYIKYNKKQKEIEDEKDQRQQEKGVLRLYREQWEKYAEKKEGAIYSLMIACIMADSERPFLYLTNLHQLALALKNLPNEHHGLSLTMIGDRESKDIGPLLRLLEKAGCPIDIVTTVRLLTWDHRLESLYWHQEPDSKKKPLAKYVAWNPLQALLLLTSMRNWPTDRKLKYRELPPIVNARLFSQTGELEYDEDVKVYIWEAMIWGEAQTEETYTLMNYFITESTIRNNASGIQGFTEVLQDKIMKAGENLSLEAYRKEYRFALVTLTRFLANVIAIGECHLELAEAIRDTICDQIRHGRVATNNDYARIAVDLLGALSGKRQNKPYCAPPKGGGGELTKRIPFGESDRLWELLHEWEANWQSG